MAAAESPSMRVKKALSAAYRNLRLCSKPEAESDSEHEKCSESDGESGKEARAHDPRFTRTWPDPQWGPVAEKVDTSALNKGPRPQPNDGLDHHQPFKFSPILTSDAYLHHAGDDATPSPGNQT